MDRRGPQQVLLAGVPILSSNSMHWWTLVRSNCLLQLTPSWQDHATQHGYESLFTPPSESLPYVGQGQYLDLFMSGILLTQLSKTTNLRKLSCFLFNCYITIPSLTNALLCTPLALEQVSKSYSSADIQEENTEVVFTSLSLQEYYEQSSCPLLFLSSETG